MSVKADWNVDFKDRSQSQREERQQPLLEWNDYKCHRTKDLDAEVTCKNVYMAMFTGLAVSHVRLRG